MAGEEQRSGGGDCGASSVTGVRGLSVVQEGPPQVHGSWARAPPAQGGTGTEAGELGARCTVIAKLSC